MFIYFEFSGHRTQASELRKKSFDSIDACAYKAARSMVGRQRETVGSFYRGVAQPGSASASGAEGRRFKSFRPDMRHGSSPCLFFCARRAHCEHCTASALVPPDALRPLTPGLRPAGSLKAVLFAPFQGAIPTLRLRPAGSPKAVLFAPFQGAIPTPGLRPAGPPQAVLFAPFQGALEQSTQPLNAPHGECTRACPFPGCLLPVA